MPYLGFASGGSHAKNDPPAGEVCMLKSARVRAQDDAAWRRNTGDSYGKSPHPLKKQTTIVYVC